MEVLTRIIIIQYMDYEKIPQDEVIKKTVDELKTRGVTVTIVDTKAEALEKIKELVPAGAGVMNGSSTTLKEIGFVDFLKEGAHGWNNLHEKILTETDLEKQAELRKQSVFADYWLGSVHAIAESGEVLVASASGSQFPAYAFTSPNVIWVASANKIVPTLEDGFKRVKEYTFPLEDARMKASGYPGSVLAKMFIFEKEVFSARKINLILVKEKLGF